MTPEEFGIDVEGFDFEGIDPSVAESPLGGLDVSDALARLPLLCRLFHWCFLSSLSRRCGRYLKKPASRLGGNVPIYNLVVLVQVAKAPMWYIAVILVGAVLGRYRS
jgi:hypothetical protein